MIVYFDFKVLNDHFEYMYLCFVFCELTPVVSCGDTYHDPVMGEQMMCSSNSYVDDGFSWRIVLGLEQDFNCS